MAPTLEEPIPYASRLPKQLFIDSQLPADKLVREVRAEEQATERLRGISTILYVPGHIQALDHTNYAHEGLKPSFPNVRWPALEKIAYDDKGSLGHPSFKYLLSSATSIRDYNTKIGCEISGIDLSTLTDLQKNDLARLIATRCVVVFRDQKNFGVQQQRELGKYWGTLHRHATTAVPAQGGLDDVHVVWAAEGGRDARSMFAPGFLWHSDVTYEIQPPSYTSLKILTSPPPGAGGDTLFSSQYAAYDILSPAMQQYLESLTALHSSHIQAEGSQALNRTVRREPIITEHPLIRTNPVTGWKSLFFNRGFVVAINGVPKVESEWLMRFLGEVVAESLEGQARFQWQENDVVFWDNRVTNHSATYGFTGHRRHAIRVACQAEVPYFDPEGKSQEEELLAKYGLPLVDKDGSGVSNYND